MAAIVWRGNISLCKNFALRLLYNLKSSLNCSRMGVVVAQPTRLDAQFRDKMRDVTEFLAALGLRPPAKEVRLRVTCQDSCHLLHGQKVRHAPRELLRAIPGIELVEMKLADHCCGSAGIYNLLHPEIAGELLAEKMEHARATGANVIVTANPGCILQLRAGAQQYSTGQEVLHVVELLDRAYNKQP